MASSLLSMYSGRQTRTADENEAIFFKFFFSSVIPSLSPYQSFFSRGGREGGEGARQGRRPARYRKESFCFSFARSSVPVSHNDGMT